MFAMYLHCQESPSVRSAIFCLAVLDCWSFLTENALYIFNDYAIISDIIKFFSNLVTHLLPYYFKELETLKNVVNNKVKTLMLYGYGGASF